MCNCVFQNAEALLKDADPASVQQDHMKSLRGYILNRLIGAQLHDLFFSHCLLLWYLINILKFITSHNFFPTVGRLINPLSSGGSVGHVLPYSHVHNIAQVFFVPDVQVTLPSNRRKSKKRCIQHNTRV